jgi:hypothetical protein
VQESALRLVGAVAKSSTMVFSYLSRANILICFRLLWRRCLGMIGMGKKHADVDGDPLLPMHAQQAADAARDRVTSTPVVAFPVFPSALCFSLS